MRWPVLVLAGVLCACEPVEPALTIVAVHPPSITAAETRTVQVELNTVPPFLVDHEQGASDEVSTVAELRLGTGLRGAAKYVGHSRFAVTVGPRFPEGTHDVWLKLEDGREALLPQGFKVYEAISGLWVETVPPQLQATPFDLVIHASGEDSDFFEGTVTVSTSKGQFLRPGNDPAKSFQSGNFSKGVRVERLAIDTPGSIVITVDDGAGSRAHSNDVIVHPK